MRVANLSIVSFCLLAVGAAALAQNSAPPADPGAPADSIAQWRSLRFGMFIHWGPVSLEGTEIGWSRAGERRGHRSGHGTQIPVEVYDNLYKQFDPIHFDADQWVAIAKQAGMRYLVFTTKHHDGFCNFDSKLTDYKITSPESPYGKDIVRQLADACHKADMPIGWYYSPPDWHHPDYRNGDRHARYIEYLHGQVRELLTNYGKIDIIWFDGLGGRPEDWDAPRLLAMIRSLQPDIIINNRAGLPADHDTPEQRVGGFNRDRPWETCMTICRQWAWKPDDLMKTKKECLQTLLHVVGGDGNLLFNVGPMPDGRIEPRQVERLSEMGSWLDQFGDAVYATRGGPFKPGSWGASTCKDNKITLFVMEWPDDGPLVLPAIGPKITAVRTRTGGEANVGQTAEGITVSLEATHRDEIATVIELTIDGKAIEVPPRGVNPLSGSLAFDKPAKASNVFHNQRSYQPGMALDDDMDTRWATDAGTHAAWLEVDLGEPQQVAGAMVDEACEGRVSEFAIEYLDGETWKPAFEGTTLGRNFRCNFPPVTARRVRLNIIQASEGPTIWEFQLFAPKK